TFYLNRQRPADAEKYLKALAARSDDGKLNLADYYIANGRNTDARALLDPLEKQQTTLVSAGVRLAAIELREGKADKAFQVVDAILKVEPNSEDARVMKLRLLLEQQRNPEAVVLAQTIVARNSSSTAGQYLLGIALARTNAIDEAINAFRNVVRIDPKNAPAHFQLATLLLQTQDLA